MNNTQAKEIMACPPKTLIVNYRGMRIGGIETYLSRLMAYSISMNYRVIWLTTKRNYDNTDFKEIVGDSRVEKVFIKGKSHLWLPHKKIKFHPNERVTMISMEPLNFLKAEQIRAYAKVESFYHFLAMPHFEGNAYYPERTFRTRLERDACHKFMRKIANKILDNDCIRAYSLKHLDYYEKNYDVVIPDKNEKVLKKINLMKDYSEEYFQNKATDRKNKFVVTTCARFDFPHKGYILGLVDDYAELKEKYPQLELNIIGFGKDEDRLNEKISKLSDSAKKDLHLIGAVMPNELGQHFEKCHMNIGLAGALFDGAICAVPSVCVRHYTEECQTYGHISDMEGTYLRDDPGENIKSYIEALINMSDDDYINQSKRDFERAKEIKTNQPEYLFEQTNTTSKSIIRGWDLFKAKWFNFFRELNRFVFKLPECEKENEK